MPRITGLSPKEWRFVRHYCKKPNATEAAIKAGYSAKTAAQIGYQLLHKTSVAAAIAERQRIYADELDFSIQEYHALLARQARGDMADYGEWDQDSLTLYPSREVDTRNIKELKIKKRKTTQTRKDGEIFETEHEEASLKLYDAQHAGKTLAEHLGYPVPPKETGPDGSKSGGGGQTTKVYGDRDWARVPRPAGSEQDDRVVQPEPTPTEEDTTHDAG